MLINPFGGGGAAAAAWNSSRPLIEKAHVELTIKHTERARHAYEIVNEDLMPG